MSGEQSSCPLLHGSQAYPYYSLCYLQSEMTSSAKSVLTTNRSSREQNFIEKAGPPYLLQISKIIFKKYEFAAAKYQPYSWPTSNNKSIIVMVYYLLWLVCFFS